MNIYEIISYLKASDQTTCLLVEDYILENLLKETTNEIPNA